MTRFASALGALTGVLLATAPAARAGIVDDPVPQLQGQSAKLVYSVTNVVNNGSLSTYFTCTNVDGGDVRVGVEVFGASGNSFNDPSVSSLLLPPGTTKIFGTSTAFGLAIDGLLAPGITPMGSARIIATSSRLVCTAFVMDPNNVIPNSAWQLTIVAKAKQKACN